jgi:cytoskeletal protein RodZ
MTDHLTGDQVKAAREALDLTMGDVARDTGIHRKALFEIERGIVQMTPDQEDVLLRYFQGRMWHVKED